MSLSTTTQRALGVALADNGAATEIVTALDTESAGSVDLTGNQTIAGVKTFSVAPVFTLGLTTTTTGPITIGEGGNFVLGTGTGTKIGTATGQKIGFFNKTPVIQPAAALQGALTNSTGGSQDGTLAAVGNTMAGNVSSDINNNFTDIYALLTEIRTALVNLGLIKGAA